MKHLFYLMAIGFIIWESRWLLNPKAMLERSKKLLNIKEIKDDNDWDTLDSKLKRSLITTFITTFAIVIWLFIGLFTFNWFLFLIYFLNMFMMLPLLKANKFNSLYMMICVYNSLFSVLFGMFVIINSYHLKIDILEWVLTLFN